MGPAIPPQHLPTTVGHGQQMEEPFVAMKPQPHIEALTNQLKKLDTSGGDRPFAVQPNFSNKTRPSLDEQDHFAYEGWTFYPSGSSSAGQKFSWSSATHSQMRVTQAELSKTVEKRNKKTPFGQEYNTLSNNKKRHIQRLLDDRKSQTGFDWDVVYVYQKKKYLGRPMLGVSKVMILSLDIIIVRGARSWLPTPHARPASGPVLPQPPSHHPRKIYEERAKTGMSHEPPYSRPAPPLIHQTPRFSDPVVQPQNTNLSYGNTNAMGVPPYHNQQQNFMQGAGGLPRMEQPVQTPVSPLVEVMDEQMHQPPHNRNPHIHAEAFDRSMHHPGQSHHLPPHLNGLNGQVHHQVPPEGQPQPFQRPGQERPKHNQSRQNNIPKIINNDKRQTRAEKVPNPPVDQYLESENSAEDDESILSHLDYDSSATEDYVFADEYQGHAEGPKPRGHGYQDSHRRGSKSYRERPKSAYPTRQRSNNMYSKDPNIRQNEPHYPDGYVDIMPEKNTRKKPDHLLRAPRTSYPIKNPQKYRYQKPQGYHISPSSSLELSAPMKNWDLSFPQELYGGRDREYDIRERALTHYMWTKRIQEREDELNRREQLQEREEVLRRREYDVKYREWKLDQEKDREKKEKEKDKENVNQFNRTKNEYAEPFGQHRPIYSPGESNNMGDEMHGFDHFTHPHHQTDYARQPEMEQLPLNERFQQPPPAAPVAAAQHPPPPQARYFR